MKSWLTIMNKLLCIIIFILSFLSYKSLAQPNFTHFYEPGIYRLDSETGNPKEKFLFIKLNKNRSRFELAMGNSFNSLVTLGNLREITTYKLLPKPYDEKVLMTADKSLAILFNYKTNQIEVVNLNTNQRLFYKEFNEKQFDIQSDDKEGDCNITWIEKDRFYFRLNVSSQNRFFGEVNGIAYKQNADQFIYRDFDYEAMIRLKMEDDPIGCTLHFNFKNSKTITIKQNSCSIYHGVGVYFEGTYLQK